MLEVVFAVLFLLVGAGLLIWTAWDFGSALSSRGWPQAEGTIVVSDLQRSRDGDSGITYRPEVTYRYSVDGREFIASRVHFGDRLEINWSAPAVRTVRRYPVGTSVAVRYNPHDPQESVLQPGVNAWILTGVALSALFTAIGILGLRSSL